MRDSSLSSVVGFRLCFWAVFSVGSLSFVSSRIRIRKRRVESRSNGAIQKVVEVMVLFICYRDFDRANSAQVILRV